MCYNITTLTLSKLKYARRIGADQEEIDRLQREYDRLKGNFPAIYFESGFAFPEVPIHTNLDPQQPKMAQFGLIPAYSKNRQQADTERRRLRTLNVRSEEVSTKRLYKDVLKEKWCVVVLDGFYEYYHFGKKKYPHFVFQKEFEPLLLVGLWNEWTDYRSGEVIISCNIFTREANGFARVLHNNPQRNGRMPWILKPDVHEVILADIEYALKHKDELTIDIDDLSFHSVGKLLGKESIGNSPEAQEKHDYPELNQSELYGGSAPALTLFD